MFRNVKGQFTKKYRPKGFLTSREALTQEIASAGDGLRASVNKKTVERAHQVVENAKRILGNAEDVHQVEKSEVTKQLENRAWMQWREAEHQLQLARQGDLTDKTRLKLAGF
jgi:hypothetical protein